MLSYLFWDFMLHGSIGFGFVVGASFFFKTYLKRPRTVFRFGGRDPFELGSKRAWTAYYLFSYAFEVLTSLHPGIGPFIYRELAASVYQAFAMVIGLYIADRVAMMIEPESHHMNLHILEDDDVPRRTPSARRSPRNTADAPEALPADATETTDFDVRPGITGKEPSTQQLPEPGDRIEIENTPADSSWLEGKTNEIRAFVRRTMGRASEQGAKIAERRRGRAASREERRIKARTERTDRLRNLTRGY